MSANSIILASGSPRRRELLEKMGVRFEVLTADIAELDAKSSPDLAPAQLAMENARLKAVAVSQTTHGAGRWVLGADTVVALSRRVDCRVVDSDFDVTIEAGKRVRDRIFGKPASLDEAFEFLGALSGQTHEVITGCALIEKSGRQHVFHEITHVTFRVLSEELIAMYLAEVHVLDKAGAYALQERGEWIIENVEGSRTNVIGLPTEKLAQIFISNGLL